MKKYFYVYEHWLDNQCFYVGKSNNITDRANLLYDCLRNKKWSEFVNGRYNSVNIKIVKKFETNIEAVKYEQLLSEKRHKEGHPLTCKRFGNKMTIEMIEEQTGENNPNYGNKWSKEVRDKYSKKLINEDKRKGIKNPRATPIIIRNKDYEQIEEYELIKDCLKKYNLSASSISLYLKSGKLNKKHNVYFTYKD